MKRLKRRKPKIVKGSGPPGTTCGFCNKYVEAKRRMVIHNLPDKKTGKLVPQQIMGLKVCEVVNDEVSYTDESCEKFDLTPMFFCEEYHNRYRIEVCVHRARKRKERCRFTCRQYQKEVLPHRLYMLRENKWPILQRRRRTRKHVRQLIAERRNTMGHPQLKRRRKRR